MNVLDLFSGIGGFSIGLERAGMRTVAFCETEPFCRAVLAKHWPGVPCYEDVRTLTADRLARDGISVDVICGGFPCQDISHAGKGAGLAGERSGLWYEFHRLIKDIKPRYAIIENVSALRSRGLDAVLGSLAAVGYDAEWHCIPASAVGAPHRRDRVWIVAYANGARSQMCFDKSRFLQPPYSIGQEWNGHIARSGGHTLEKWGWTNQSTFVRVADGVRARSHRLKALGNAVVPQIPEIIGKAVMSHASRNA